jgi:hypothetical protein
MPRTAYAEKGATNLSHLFAPGRRPTMTFEVSVVTRTFDNDNHQDITSHALVTLDGNPVTKILQSDFFLYVPAAHVDPFCAATWGQPFGFPDTLEQYIYENSRPRNALRDNVLFVTQRTVTRLLGQSQLPAPRRHSSSWPTFLAITAFFAGALFAAAGFLAAVLGLLATPEFATPLWKRR